MKKKKVILVTVLFVLALFNTVLITDVFSKTPDISSGVEPDGGTYHCFWMADHWGSGPIARDCVGCVDMLMENPHIMGTCSTNLFE